MGELAHDLRHALRAIGRARAFSAIAIGCLAVGIAVNAAAFSVLDALLLRDLPGVVRQKELSAVLVSHETRWGRLNPGHLSPLDWEVYARGIPAFSSNGVAGTASVALRLSSGPLAARAEFVSGEYFATLGARSATGRLLTSEDDAPGAETVAVIGHDVWEREFDRRGDAIGSTISIAGVAFTIVGVASEGFTGLYPGELVGDPEHGAPYVYLPLAAAPLVRAESRYRSVEATLDDRWLRLVGRRRRGVTPSEVESQARVLAAAMAAEYPRDRLNASAVVRLPNTASTAETIAGVAFTMAIPILILLVACANLANQLLARGVQRGREIAVRLSLGATRARLVRMLLVESAVLAIAASAAGLLLARLLTDAMRAFVLPIPFRIPIDGRVTAFTIVLAFVTAIAFGLVPALRATRVDLANAIKEGGSARGWRRSRLRSGLVVTQVAASIALLALAGVFTRGAQRSRMSEDPANLSRVLTVAVDLELMGYAPAAGIAFQERAMERLRALPGVEAVALAPFGPSQSIPDMRVVLPGDDPDRERGFETVRVSGDWFAVRGTRAIVGRLFTASEVERNAPVAVVDEVAARKLWPDQGALGQTLRIGEDSTAAFATVVGVIPMIKDRHAHNDDGAIIVPASGRYHTRPWFYLRTRGDAADLRATARSVVGEIDPRIPVPAVRTLGESLDELGAGTRQLASGVAAMATIAMLLAALGLWAVLSFIVEQRRREIGVRIALGAQAGAVTWMIVRQSLRLAVVGIGIGVLVAVGAATGLRGILFGLPPIDPLALGGSTALVLVVALLASAAPARRAATVDPMVPLRAE